MTIFCHWCWIFWPHVHHNLSLTIYDKFISPKLLIKFILDLFCDDLPRIFFNVPAIILRIWPMLWKVWIVKRKVLVRKLESQTGMSTLYNLHLILYIPPLYADPNIEIQFLNNLILANTEFFSINFSLLLETSYSSWKESKNWNQNKVIQFFQN